MPRVGSDQVDVRAVRMIHDWIAGMPGARARLNRNGRGCRHSLVRIAPLSRRFVVAIGRHPRSRSMAIRRLASSTRGALLLLGAIDRGTMSEPLRREIVAVTRSSPSVEVRDLFERFIPESERIKRLGDVVDRSSILTLRGDAKRGRRDLRHESRGPMQDLPQGRRRRPVRRARPGQDRVQVRPCRPSRSDPRTLQDHRSAICLLPGGDQGRAGLDRVGRGEERSRGRAEGRPGQDDLGARGRGRAAGTPDPLAHARAPAARPDGPASGRLARVSDDASIRVTMSARDRPTLSSEAHRSTSAIEIRNPPRVAR